MTVRGGMGSDREKGIVSRRAGMKQWLVSRESRIAPLRSNVMNSRSARLRREDIVGILRVERINV